MSEKKAYLMTLQQYLVEVVPVLKAYKDFLKKHKSFIKINYGSLPTVSYPEIKDAMARKENIGNFDFKREWMGDGFPWYKEYTNLLEKYKVRSWTDLEKIASKGEMQSLTQLRTEGEGPGKKPLSSNELHDRYSYETREERLREGWSRYGIEVFPLDKYPTKEVIAAKNEFVAKLVSLFDAYFFENLIGEPENMKTNKRAIKYAIDKGIYKNLIDSNSVTIEQINEYAQSADVKLPKSLFQGSTILRENIYKEIFTSIPSINRDKLKELVKQIDITFKPLADIIYDQEYNRYKALIDGYLTETEIQEENLISSINFCFKLFVIGKTWKKEIEIISRNKNGQFQTKMENVVFVGKLSLKSGWEQVLRKEILDYIESLKSKFIQSILESFNKITLPIVGFEQITLKLGAKGFEGVYRFDFANGSYFNYRTEAIAAGGYNIQIFHFRYLTKFDVAKTEDGTTLKDPPLSVIIQNFSDKDESEKIFNPYLRVQYATDKKEVGEGLYQWMKSAFNSVRFHDGKDFYSITYKDRWGRSLGFYISRNDMIGLNQVKENAGKFLDANNAPKPKLMAKGG